MHDFFAERDPGRLVHYEGVFHYRPSDAASDMESTMYVKPEHVRHYAETADEDSKPYLLCEFSHAMGNSLGNFYKYTELFDEYPILQGGFIWDWKDQSLLTETEDGTPFLAYGGDFGESPHDGNFSGDGVIFGDGTVSPKLPEVKRCYQNVDFSAVDLANGEIKVKNKFLFTDLADYQFVWQIDKNGEKIESGSVEVALAPGEDAIVKLGYQLLEDARASEVYILTVQLLEKVDRLWCEVGHEVAFSQFILPVEVRGRVEKDVTSSAGLEVVERDGRLVVSGDDFVVGFDLDSGLLESYQIDGVELIQEGLRPNFWRASTDNDRGNKLHERSAIWREVDQHRQLVGFGWDDSAGALAVETEFLYPQLERPRVKISYSVDVPGSIDIDHHFHPGEASPASPTEGLMLEMADTCDRVNWYSKCQHENY